MLIDVGAFENYGKPSCPFIMPCSHSDGQLLALNPPCLDKSMLNLESCPSVTVGCKKNTLPWLWSSFAKPYECA